MNQKRSNNLHIFKGNAYTSKLKTEKNHSMKTNVSLITMLKFVCSNHTNYNQELYSQMEVRLRPKTITTHIAFARIIFIIIKTSDQQIPVIVQCHFFYAHPASVQAFFNGKT